ncbi:hypothetical protein DIS24_g8329 [Lasiodiplodia hormozganensis]|uniref:Uncharacterized protein n=1 Tax=Lasiodiplodia hormozganensis TaxID=869390 RepID=A0AA39Y5R3_9PEZI|nr:hypothetical protein DIS24_g8329 [Lasiodiplodia hormozganensis]
MAATKNSHEHFLVAIRQFAPVESFSPSSIMPRKSSGPKKPTTIAGAYSEDSAIAPVEEWNIKLLNAVLKIAKEGFRTQEIRSAIAAQARLRHRSLCIDNNFHSICVSSEDVDLARQALTIQQDNCRSYSSNSTNSTAGSSIDIEDDAKGNMVLGMYELTAGLPASQIKKLIARFDGNPKPIITEDRNHMVATCKLLLHTLIRLVKEMVCEDATGHPIVFEHESELNHDIGRIVHRAKVAGLLRKNIDISSADNDDCYMAYRGFRALNVTQIVRFLEGRTGIRFIPASLFSRYVAFYDWPESELNKYRQPLIKHLSDLPPNVGYIEDLRGLGSSSGGSHIFWYWEELRQELGLTSEDYDDERSVDGHCVHVKEAWFMSS